MARQISEITRRDIREALEGVAWWGRLEEVEFLSRLYPLDSLPSTDPRHRTAAEDIVRHRVANDDWPNDWVFTDERLGLADGEDAERLAAQLNKLLRPDGYELVPKGQISGRPVFGWDYVSPAHPSAEKKEKHFTEDVGPLVATLSQLARLDGSDLEQEVLLASRPRLEEPEHDNWDGGTYYYTLTLAVPVEVFARLGAQVSSLEQQIAKRIEQVLRTPDKHRITAVVIQPIEAALRTMDAMAALLTPDFRQSRWTDQEVGWALGLGVYVLPVRRGLDPYGFLGEVQGSQGQGKTVRVVADELFASLLRHQKTRERLLEVLLGQFEQSSSSQEAATNLALVERAGTLPRSLLRRLEEASSRNRHISGTQGVLDRLKYLLGAAGVAT